MESGFHIAPDRSIRDPEELETGWSVSDLGIGVEAVWGPEGDTGWRLAGGLFHTPNGGATSYYVVDDGETRTIRGPDARLPWA